MSKGILYALPRMALRHERADYARAVELFTSTGVYQGDPVLVAFVVTYCFDHKIAFRWDLVGDGQALGTSKIVREKPNYER